MDAQDNTLRLWDLRTTVCQGLLAGVGGQGLAAQPCAAFDAQVRTDEVAWHGLCCWEGACQRAQAGSLAVCLS